MNNATIHTYSISENASRMIQKLQSFRQLKENWDSYGAAKPSVNAINRAISLVKTLDLANQPVYFVAPGPNGEIVVEFREGEYSIEITVDDEGKEEYVTLRNGILLSEPATFDSLPVLVRWLASNRC